MTSPVSRRGFLLLAGAGLASLAGLTACQSAAATGAASAGASGASGSASAGASGYLSATEVHRVAFAFPEADYQAMLAAYLKDGTKGWLKATVTIDGTEHAGAGIRLKGNSSLKTIAATSKAQGLPWMVRLDKFTEGANHHGMTQMIVRSNSSKTALNEAVALDLLTAAGLPSERAAYIALSANGSDAVLRLTVENLNEAWTARTFAEAGLLYKAEASGDYSWRGKDAASYDDVFDQESGEDNLTPLIGFLDFINNSDDATFKGKLGDHVDVDAFATYLGFEALVDNFDDIDGPGNNSYLWWAEKADRMTVVAWDHNLAFGLRPGGEGMAGRPAGGPAGGMPPGGMPPGGMPAGGMPTGIPPTGEQLPEGGMGQPQGGRAGGGPGMKANPLVTRFTSLLDGSAKVTAAQARLKTELYTSGKAAGYLDTWAALLTAKASELVPAATVTTERDAVAAYFTK